MEEAKSRRRVPRRIYKKPIGLLYQGEYHVGVSHEIGEGGMLIEAHSELDLENLILITFHVPGILNTTCRAEVRYKSPNSDVHLYGVEFLNLDFDVKRLIRKYVAQRSMDEDPLSDPHYSISS